MTECRYCSRPLLPTDRSCPKCGGPTEAVLVDVIDPEVGEPVFVPFTDEGLEAWTAWQYRQPPPSYTDGLDFMTHQQALVIRTSPHYGCFDFPFCGFLRYVAVGGRGERLRFRLVLDMAQQVVGDEVRLPFSFVLATPLMLQMRSRVRLEFESQTGLPSELRIRYDITEVPARIGK
jgi:hypothetical protein